MINVESVYMSKVNNGYGIVVCIYVSGSWYEVIADYATNPEHFAEVANWSVEDWARAKQTSTARELNVFNKETAL